MPEAPADPRESDTGADQDDASQTDRETVKPQPFERRPPAPPLSRPGGCDVDDVQGDQGNNPHPKRRQPRAVTAERDDQSEGDNQPEPADQVAEPQIIDGQAPAP